MESNHLASKDNSLQDIPSERTMRNWLATWRSLNHDLQQLQKSAKEFETFIELATNQIDCYENILKERKFYNYKFFKNVTNFGEKHFVLGDLIDKIVSLKDEILDTESTLEECKLELQGVQKKLIPTANKSQLAAKSLAESKVIYVNLKKRNLLLKAVKGEAMELYRSRDQMFDYQLIEKAIELLNIQSKTKAIQDASKRLQTNIDDIQLQERILIRQLAAGFVMKNERNKYFHKILQYLRFLWECVSSLAHCPKLKEPYNKFHCAMI